jgi:hypothetical protein
MNITIENNIPIPPKGRGRKRIYPFEKMSIGDSFYVPAKKANAVRYCAHFYRSRNKDFHFTTRSEKGADGGYGVRVWRIKSDQ